MIDEKHKLKSTRLKKFNRELKRWRLEKKKRKFLMEKAENKV